MSSSQSTTSSVLDIHNKVSCKELEDIITTHVKSVIEDKTLASKLPPILIHGSPGLGKSSIVRSVAENLNIGFIDVRLAQIESCDIKGLPVPDNNTHTMQWYVNGVWPRDPNSKGILFLDELTSCPSDVQVASYELVLDRRLGDLYKLPDGWVVIAAGNNTTDRAVAKTMSSALANRFLHLEIDANSEDWILWAQHNDVHPAVVGFISYRNEYLFHMEHENLERGWPSPRSWERVSNILKLYSNLDAESNLLRKLVYGLVGNRAGVEFMEFLKINEKFDNVLDYMIDPNKEIKIPDRADAKYAIVSSMTYLLWKGKSKEDESKRLDGFYRITMKLPSDFASLALTMAMSGPSISEKKHYCDALSNHSRYKEFMKKYSSSLRKRITI